MENLAVPGLLAAASADVAKGNREHDTDTAATWEEVVDEFAVPLETTGATSLTKWDLRRIKTRRLILHAGREVFATRGTDAPKVEDVARSAGISRAGFYLHFKSLEELMLAVFRREVRWQLRRYRSLTFDILLNERKLRGWLERFFASFRQERDYILIIYRTLSHDPSMLSVMFAEHEAMLERLARRLPELRLFDETGVRNERRFIAFYMLIRRIEEISLYSAFSSWNNHLDIAVEQIATDLRRISAADSE
jgi:AcrR family transcriptional regulator